MGYEFIDDSRVPVIVLDISILSLEERRKKAVKYNTLKLASSKLGLSYNVIKSAIEKRKRIFSPILNKEIAIRYIK
jgi:hypothetical protein